MSTPLPLPTEARAFAASPAPSEGDIDMAEEEDAIERALSQVNEEDDEPPPVESTVAPKKRARAPRTKPQPTADDDAAAAKKGSELLEDLLQRAKDFMSGINLDDNEFATPVQRNTSRTGERGGGASRRGKRGGRLTEREEDDQLLHDLEDEAKSSRTTFVPLTEQPSIVTGKMRPYQLEGLNWMVRLYHCGASGILADEMGLGKTLQSISLLAYLKQFRHVDGPHLVLTPLSTLGNWFREFQRWCPLLRVLKFHGSKEERVAMIAAGELKMTDYDICLTSYEMAIREKTHLNKIDWHFIVVDEAHRLKNENSLLSVIVRFFSSQNRLLITGTPLQNNLHELWALLNFLLPNLFHSSENFDAIFNQAETDSFEGKERGVTLLENLQKLLRPFMLRRLKTQVEKDLPPKKISLIYTGLTSLQRKLYKSILERDVEALLGTVKEKSRLMNIVMQLRKVADHPFLFDGVEEPGSPVYGNHLVTASGKMLLIDKLLHHLKQRESRVLIFSQMTRMLDILEDYCIYKQFQYCRIDGNTPQSEREEAMHRYNQDNSEKFIFLLSTRAGGLGINLYTADTVILYDSDWNPQMDLQAMDRAHRIGQKKQVNVFRLISEDTVEVQMLKRAEVKLHLDAMLIQQGRGAAGTKAKTGISTDDLTKMIRYGADKIFRQTEADNINDADIVNILERGELIQQELEQGLKSHVNALEFSLDGKIETSMLPDDGDNAALDSVASEELKRKRDLEMMAAITSKPRERKQLYVYNDKITKSLIPKPAKLPRMFDHQLYDRARIEALSEKENDFFERYKFDPNPPALKGLTAEEEQELALLVKEGFSDWSFTDYQTFLHACLRYGRHNIDKIVSACQLRGKTRARVLDYHRAMFELNRLTTLKSHEAILAKLVKSERRVAKFAEMESLLEQSLAQYPSRTAVLTQFPISAQPMAKSRGFSEMEDKFLLWLCRECGFGQWREMAAKILVDPQFAMDYFLVSRTPDEIQRRVTLLIREIERGGKQAKTKKASSGNSKKGKSGKEESAVDEDGDGDGDEGALTTGKSGRQVINQPRSHKRKAVTTTAAADGAPSKGATKRRKGYQHR